MHMTLHILGNVSSKVITFRTFLWSRNLQKMYHKYVQYQIIKPPIKMTLCRFSVTNYLMKTMATFQQPIPIQFILINFVNIFATISHSIKQTSALVLETQK